MRAVSRISKQARGIAGVAPVLHFPSATAKPDQVAANTTQALELIRAQLGEKPEPYTRKYDVSFERIKSEIDTILASCGSKEAPLEDGKELTQMQVIERVLRHGLCSYQKNEGNCSWEDIEKWLVYTATDSQEFNKLKREKELTERYQAYKGSNNAPCVPEFNWAAEYEAAIDREAVAEKRRRYEEVAVTAFERDEKAIEAELAAYKKPVQDKLLDDLVDQVNLFKPFLAKMVIQAKLIERNCDGQLTYSRFADWNPDARDLAELHVEADVMQATVDTPLPVDETNKRYADVRMKTKEEVLSTMDSAQSSAIQAAGGSLSLDGDEARHAAMLAEIIKLQSRSTTEEKDTSSSELSQEEKEAAAEAARVAHEAEMAKYNVSDAVVAQKGLLGLGFVDVKSASAQASP